MPKPGKLLAPAISLALSLAAAAVPAGAQEEEGKIMYKVVNTSANVAHCTFVVDGRSDKYLHMKPGETVTQGYLPGRYVQLVCERAKDLEWGPLKTGVAYTLVDGKKWLEMVEK
jgi:hypothetical protein